MEEVNNLWVFIFGVVGEEKEKNEKLGTSILTHSTLVFRQAFELWYFIVGMQNIGPPRYIAVVMCMGFWIDVHPLSAASLSFFLFPFLKWKWTSTYLIRPTLTASMKGSIM